MLQLVIENAAALAALIGATAGAIATIANAIAKIAPLFSRKVNSRARRLERAKHGKR